MYLQASSMLFGYIIVIAKMDLKSLIFGVVCTSESVRHKGVAKNIREFLAERAQNMRDK